MIFINGSVFPEHRIWDSVFGYGASTHSAHDASQQAHANLEKLMEEQFSDADGVMNVKVNITTTFVSPENVLFHLAYVYGNPFKYV